MNAYYQRCFESTQKKLSVSKEAVRILNALSRERRIKTPAVYTGSERRQPHVVV